MRGETVVATALALAGGYLLGSVPVAVALARRHRFDPRTVGDLNPGWWNMRAQLGDRQALPVFLGDTAKGAAAAVLGLAVAPAGAWGVGYAALGAAMVGHGWPLFARFRGGRSVLTWVGGMCVLSPIAAALAMGAFLALTLAGRLAMGARLGVGAFPILQLWLDSPFRTAATGALMVLIALRFALASNP